MTNPYEKYKVQIKDLQRRYDALLKSRDGTAAELNRMRGEWHELNQKAESLRESARQGVIDWSIELDKRISAEIDLKNEKAEKRFWKNTCCIFAVGAFLLTALLLTGCASAPETPPALNIYSPLVLTVEPGTPIQTVDGVYTPQVRETWWSDKEYRELNDKYVELLGRQSK